MLDRPQARLIAEAYAREQAPRWDEWGCELIDDPGIAVEGAYVFGISQPTRPDPRGRVPRIGGNWPVAVDRMTGECRRIALDEYFELRRKTKPGRPRSPRTEGGR